MNRPWFHGNWWLIRLGPWIIPQDSREELATLAHNRTPKEYADAVWDERPKPMRHKSHSWPQSNRARGKYSPFVIPKPVSNVTPIRKRKP